MEMSLSLYRHAETPVHACDARVKLALLLACSVSVFFIDEWAGMACVACMVAACVVAAGLSFGPLVKASVPVLVIMAFIWAFNAFTFDVAKAALDWAQQHRAVLDGAAQAGIALSGWEFVGCDAGAPVALVGSFGFLPEGSNRILLYAARIELILVAGLVVALTTQAERLTQAFACLLEPLRAVRVPVDDVSLALSLVIRFIPMVAEELQRLRLAQAARGALFESGGAWRRLRTWLSVLTPLVVGLFRRGGRMAEAMDARCYGAARRTSLEDSRPHASEMAAMVLACAAFALLAFV